jgi:putative MFS transporter
VKLSGTRRLAFWTGTAAVTAGVLLHLPMFLSASNTNYRLAGMRMDASMIVGMALIGLGILSTAYGLLGSAPLRRSAAVTRLSIRPLDDAALGRAHLVLILVMAVAVTIDVMKPLTLGFVVPGMAKEYGLKSPVNPHGHVPVALLPLFGTVGTVIGSFLWGSLADRVGRRASILLAATIFMGTAICGAMPDYQMNFAMCFVMGLGAGGLLPIAFSLISEMMPTRQRGWLMVLVGGDIAFAYLLTSWLSGLLTPHFGWRIMWLIGLPTGLLLVLLNRWIPESPRFLIACGRPEEATAVMERYGARLTLTRSPELEATGASPSSRWLAVFGPGLRRSAVVIAMLGIAIGFVAFGFQLWVPSALQAAGFTGVTSADIVRDAALFGLPATVVVAVLYGRWSSRKTMLLVASVTVVALVVLALEGSGIIHHRALLYVLLSIPITAASSLVAVLAAYAAEVFPTGIRARASGLAAGTSKAGGVLVSVIIVAAVTLPSIGSTALIGAIAMGIAALTFAAVGVETRGRTLEEISTGRVPSDLSIEPAQ